jgi:phosphatidylglycerophosphate synthase
VTPSWGWVVLGVVGLGLVLLSGFSARPTDHKLPSTPRERAEIWQRLHDAPHIDPLANPLQRWFLAVTYGLATPLARRGVLPDVLTLWGLWLAGVAAVLGWIGGRWLLVAAAVLVLSSFTDGVDGAVAGMTERASQRGQVLDAVVDRLSECLFVAAVVAGAGNARAASSAGVSAGVGAGVGAMGAIALFEYLRARIAVSAVRLGLDPVGSITIAERPTRVIGCTIALIAMGIRPQSASFVGTWSLVLVGVVTILGTAQLFANNWRRLAG